MSIRKNRFNFYLIVCILRLAYQKSALISMGGSAD